MGPAVAFRQPGNLDFSVLNREVTAIALMSVAIGKRAGVMTSESGSTSTVAVHRRRAFEESASGSFKADVYIVLAWCARRRERRASGHIQSAGAMGWLGGVLMATAD